MGGGSHMDPRDTPGYRTHLALTNLRRIDRDQLEPADRALVETASRALWEVTYLDTSEATSD
jgi:hypothetical protein